MHDKEFLPANILQREQPFSFTCWINGRTFQNTNHLIWSMQMNVTTSQIIVSVIASLTSQQ